MPNRITYLISVLMLLSLIENNVRNNYHQLIDNIYFIIQVLLIIEIAPTFYRFIDI
jgi:hypothetical protein